jgi:deazaflavin-dependent oxidoreductase (nitroreductase family)
VPNDATFRVMNTVHRGLVRLSFGKLGWQVKMPVLELTTTGRRSGRPRRVMLTSPAREGDALVIVASRGGDDRHPDWYLNLVAQPEVEVVYRGEPKRTMRARTATPEERARLWPTIAATYDGYAGYQAKTDREIPVVLLEPAS